MTAKNLRKERVIDCTRGLSREQRAYRRSKLAPGGSDVPKRLADGSKRYKDLHLAINDMRKFQAQREALEAYREWQIAEVKEQIGIPDQAATDSNFVEKPFSSGSLITSASDTQLLSRIVVSLALFDGDKMLFACSGIPLPEMTPTKLDLTRFVTSARLAEEFHANRYRDDKLRVEVRLPNRTVEGLLGLYDIDIAIVTCFCILDVHPVDLVDPKDLDLPEKFLCHGNDVVALGCTFRTGTLMATNGSLCTKHTWVTDTQNSSEAVLGGPLIGEGMKFLGMNCQHVGDANVKFLPQKLLRERLLHFQILNPKVPHFREYSLPEGVKRIIPSGFVDAYCRILSWGYPIPPPLVLELNGRLLNRFEEYFGDIIAWKGYPFGCPPRGSEYGVWRQLPETIVTNVSRSVVSVASFCGNARFFVCSGLLIRWLCSTVVLTSASLVRSNNEDEIDNKLRIEVFLPLNHINRVSGMLEFYSLHYNIAIISFANKLGAIRPAKISDRMQEPSGKVVAIGRDPDRGLLMGSLGEVKGKKKDVKSLCKDLKLSTCKIKKSGIGGPLISLDGSFVGMNFYDGREVTPFLPRNKILDVLRDADSYVYTPGVLESFPSERGECIQIGEPNTKTKNKWPVPKAYWYHGILDVDRDHLPNLPGRRLH